MKRRTLFLAVSATALGLPARARVEDTDWLDPARGRTLPLRWRWPDGNAPCALVLHSHGLGGSRDGGDAWGRAWRDAGIAVVHLQHPGSDTEAARGGRRALRDAATAQQLVARVADMRFVIDEVERRARAGEPGFARLRLDAIGASGHSFGAHTVQALAGQRYGAGVGAPFVEPRLRAFGALSPSPARQRPGRGGAFDGVARPLLCVTGSLDQNPLGEEITGEHRLAVYDGLPAGRRALLWLEGADHMTFAGNAERPIGARFGPFRRDPGAARRESEDHAIVAAITTSWWREHLQGEAAALRTLPPLRPGDRWRRD